MSRFNYNSDSNTDDGSCEYARLYYDCDGVCLLDSDGDGVCDELCSIGCTGYGLTLIQMEMVFVIDL